MVVATETGNLNANPVTIAKEIPRRYYMPGSGTDPRAFSEVAKHHGLKEKYVGHNFKAAEQTLHAGGLAIAHAKPGHFTSAGHYMVLRKVNHGSFTLADPNGKPGRDSEKRHWSARQLSAAGIDNLWTFKPGITH